MTPEAARAGKDYLVPAAVRRQRAGAHCIDVNVDEIDPTWVDSAIIDPVSLDVERVQMMDRDTRPFRMAADVLTGVDLIAMAYLAAHRAGELDEG